MKGSMKLRARVIAILCLGLVSLGGICQKAQRQPSIHITTPSLTVAFDTASTILIQGFVANANPGQIASAEVVYRDATGTRVFVDVTPLAAGNIFSVSVPLTPSRIVNSVVAQATLTSGKLVRDRITVIAGDGNPGVGGTGFILDGAVSPEAAAFRLNDSGLDQAEPVIEAGVNLDLASLLPVGTLVISQFCVADSFLGCLGRADVYIDPPPASIGGFSIDVDAQTNSADADVDITSLHVNLFVDGTSGIAPNCDAEIDATLLEIDGNYGLSPESNPVQYEITPVDVTQNGSLTLNFSGFNFNFTSGICDLPLIGDLISLIVGDLEPTVTEGLRDFMDDPDGAGPLDGPIGDEIELALATINIADAIGQGIGVEMDAPLFAVLEDVDGITLDSDVTVTATNPLPDAADQTASYHVIDVFPSYGPTVTYDDPLNPGTPKVRPYDTAIGISTSGFNQLLKAETESGLLLLVGPDAITEFEVAPTLTLPLTAEVIATFLVPEFAAFPALTLFKIELRPQAAPIFTGNPGPSGELVELQIGHLLFEIRHLTNDQLYLQGAVDLKVGADLGFVGGLLQFSLGAAIPQNIEFDLLVNRTGSDELILTLILQAILPLFLPSLGDSLGSFPIPDFLGLTLGGLDVGEDPVVLQNGAFYSIFANLTPGGP